MLSQSDTYLQIVISAHIVSTPPPVTVREQPLIKLPPYIGIHNLKEFNGCNKCRPHLLYKGQTHHDSKHSSIGSTVCEVYCRKHRPAR